MAFNMAFKKNLITRGALDAINGYYLENNFCKKKESQTHPNPLSANRSNTPLFDINILTLFILSVKNYLLINFSSSSILFFASLPTISV